MAALNSPEERTKLLKAGIDGKQIEKMWVKHNNFKPVSMILKTDMMI